MDNLKIDISSLQFGVEKLAIQQTKALINILNWEFSYDLASQKGSKYEQFSLDIMTTLNNFYLKKNISFIKVSNINLKYGLFNF